MDNMFFKSVLIIFGLTVLSCVGARAEDAAPAASACRTVGEAFSLGGVPGPNGWPQAEINCCPGLTDRENKEDYDEACMNQLAGGYYGRCIACGDGVCDEKFESRCNCPEDCTP